MHGDELTDEPSPPKRKWRQPTPAARDWRLARERQWVEVATAAELLEVDPSEVLRMIDAGELAGYL
ncbi:MAG TPA: hypothetical protein VFP61_01305, partial [Acidimicrobiales bacterium]|nr:hypothetical protein [Acidimicrobiales bacterium]